MTAYGLIFLLVAMAVWGLWRLRHNSRTQRLRRDRLRTQRSIDKRRAAELAADGKPALEADGQ